MQHQLQSTRGKGIRMKKKKLVMSSYSRKKVVLSEKQFLRANRQKKIKLYHRVL